LNIARTTLSSKILTHDKDHFAELAVDAVMRLKGSTNLESINIIKKPGGTLRVSHLIAKSGACVLPLLTAQDRANLASALS
jgi:chaperonin GroEL (HSP60 family)